MIKVDILLVGGGGGHGNHIGVYYSNPGGGGEVKEYTDIVLNGGQHNVIVGNAGISGAYPDNPTAGGDSYFDNYKANGGGATPNGSTPIRAGTSGSGNLGGLSSGSATGGGGGNSAAGTDAGSNKGGNGGGGTSKWGTYYGAGLAGKGDSGAGTPGTGYQNAGRGGGYDASGSELIALKGIVKVRYLTASSISGCTGGTITTEGDYTIHTFTENGYFIVPKPKGGVGIGSPMIF